MKLFDKVNEWMMAHKTENRIGALLGKNYQLFKDELGILSYQIYGNPAKVILGVDETRINNLATRLHIVVDKNNLKALQIPQDKLKKLEATLGEILKNSQTLKNQNKLGG